MSFSAIRGTRRPGFVPACNSIQTTPCLLHIIFCSFVPLREDLSFVCTCISVQRSRCCYVSMNAMCFRYFNNAPIARAVQWRRVHFLVSAKCGIKHLLAHIQWTRQARYRVAPLVKDSCMKLLLYMRPPNPTVPPFMHLASLYETDQAPSFDLKQRWFPAYAERLGTCWKTAANGAESFIRG